MQSSGHWTLIPLNVIAAAATAVSTTGRPVLEDKHAVRTPTAAACDNVARAAMNRPPSNDTFWHLRAGGDIWRTGAIPRFDHYSHTFPGAPWPDHEWLSQALMFLVYRVGGMPGLEIGATALVMGAAAVSWRFMVGPL